MARACNFCSTNLVGALTPFLLGAAALGDQAVVLPPGARVHGLDQSVLTAPVGSEDLRRRVEALTLRLAATEPTRVMSNQGGWQSVKYMHRRGFPEIEELGREMRATAAAYLRLPGLAPAGTAPAGTIGSPQFEVTDVWVNVADAGGETYWHTHNADAHTALKGLTALPVVGVYYAAVGNSGPSRLLLRGTQKEVFHVSPERGLATFFPAHMQHAVESHRNLTSEPAGPRISVTFNLTPRWFSSDAQRASYFGDLAAVERLVRTEREANAWDTSRDGRGRSLLITAVEAGHAPLASHLLGLRANVLARRNNGQGVLHGVSASAGDTSVLASMLLTARASISVKSMDGSEPLHQAVLRGSEALVELLLREGAHADQRNILQRQGPLHRAAESGRARIAKLLLEHGATPRTIDSSGRIPFHRAAEEGHHEIVKLLADSDAGLPWEPVKGRRMPDAGDLPAHLAAHRGYLRVLEDLGSLPGMLQARGAMNQTLLHAAVRRPRTHVMTWLLERRADLHAQNVRGLEPLHVAAAHGHIRAVELLLEAGADPCGAASDGTPVVELAANVTALAMTLQERCATQMIWDRSGSSGMLRGGTQAYALSTPPCTGAELQLV